jgi:hypothetical protein
VIQSPVSDATDADSAAPLDEHPLLRDKRTSIIGGLMSAFGPISEVAPFDERSPSCRDILGSQKIYCTKLLRDRGLHPGLLFQFLHAMLLIVEHGRREGERAAHAHVGKRDHDRALGVLGLDVADDSTHITEVRDFRDGSGRHQGDLERHRRIKDVHEFASLLWLIEHRRHPFYIERDDSIVADDREYGSVEPRLLEGVGLTDVMVQDHKTTYLIPDVDTLWRGGFARAI